MTDPATLADRPPGLDGPSLAKLQRRTIVVLSAGQILGGISFGATVSLGAILAARLSGDDALSGLATASITLGTALTAVPLAALARRRGRRPALATGLLVALVGVGLVIAAVTTSGFPLLLTGFVLIGAGQAANLQSRFAAADLATRRHPGPRPVTGDLGDHDRRRARAEPGRPRRGAGRTAGHA